MLQKYIYTLMVVLALTTGSATICADSGLPIPRFVSLRSDEINVRVGPGKRYPIKWVFKRRGLPVEIIAEFEQWRQIRDHEGAIGWVHKTMLSGAEMIMVKSRSDDSSSSPNQQMHGTQNPSSPIIAEVQPGVIGELVKCHGSMCQVHIAEYKGWIDRDGLWGVYPEKKAQG